MWSDSRYGSERMKMLWSYKHQLNLWCAIWRNVMTAQQSLMAGSTAQQFTYYTPWTELVPENESSTGHEIDSLRELMERQYPPLRMMHFALTSSDVADNADAVRVSKSVSMIWDKLGMVIESMALSAFKYADVPAMGYTHLQAAEVTSLGYRILGHVTELYKIWEILPDAQSRYPLFKSRPGAVGTGSLMDLFSRGNGDNILRDALRTLCMEEGVAYHENTTVTQTSSRANENHLLQEMASLATAAARFAVNVRHMQMMGLLREPSMGKVRHVGSSAMPHKSNPILSENINGLARLVVQLVNAHSQMCAEQVLERTLDDSSLRRMVLPQVFLYIDEILEKLLLITRGWTFDLEALQADIDRNLPKVFSSRLLLALLLVYPEKSRSEVYEEVQTLLAPLGSVTINDLYEIVNQAYPDLAPFLLRAGISEHFWKARYSVNRMSQYVVSQIVPMSRLVRSARIMDNPNDAKS